MSLRYCSACHKPLWPVCGSRHRTDRESLGHIIVTGRSSEAVKLVHAGGVGALRPAQPSPESIFWDYKA